jgi:molybdopterin-guanine dinucleotide biosynthesis protein A
MRMGGADKAMLHLGDRRMIDHVIARLRGQCAQIAINANGDPSRFAEFGLPVLADSIADAPGPLAGVLAGLDWAAGLGARTIVTAAADTPFFPLDMAERLHAPAGHDRIVLAASRDESGTLRCHPTFGIWPVALRADLRMALRQGVRKVRAWADRHDATTVEFPLREHDPFFNINTPQDLAIARRRFGMP